MLQGPSPACDLDSPAAASNSLLTGKALRLMSKLLVALRIRKVHLDPSTDAVRKASRHGQAWLFEHVVHMLNGFATKSTGSAAGSDTSSQSRIISQRVSNSE